VPKRNLKITMPEEEIVAIKRYAKEHGTSVSALVTGFMENDLAKWKQDTRCSS